ncbi:recombinase family protein [Brevibacillus agri]|uniref:recombinase family protein n=1 Tax=Brevibacillus agri TaxID=51101 RepID=UPI0018CFD85A|nr:recombinase family protein [Brevibacillus agri]
MAVGIYARVSTSQQTDNTSIDEQIRLCKEKAKTLGYFDSNIIIYREEGRSGEDIDTRIELAKLREDVASGRVSAVICTHPDRFSRDLTDKLIACREFEKNGAKLHFTDTEFTDSPEGQLFFNIMSAIASYELALIRKRTIRGRLAKVKNDKKIMPMRVAPFGYDKDEDGQLIVNEKEKQYVQMIYEWYIHERLTMREIGDRLYQLGVRPKRGESPNWSASSIRRILTSEIYIGRYYYNRRATEKVRGQLTEGGNPKKTYSFRSQEDWLEIEVTPIIDEELWKIAQQQREVNDKNKHVGSKKHEYLLKSLLKCGHCGRTYQATTYRGQADKITGEKERYRCYRCPNKFPKKYGPEVSKCHVPSVRADRIEAYIWGHVTEIIADPQRFVTRMKGKNDDSFSGIKETMASLEKDLKKKTAALEKVERALFEAEDEADLDRYEQYRNDYKKAIKALTSELDHYQRKIDALRMGELTIEQIQHMVGKVKERLHHDDTVSFEIKRTIIEMLFDEISITFENENEMVITSTGLFDTLSTLHNSIFEKKTTDLYGLWLVSMS